MRLWIEEIVHHQLYESIPYTLAITIYGGSSSAPTSNNLSPSLPIIEQCNPSNIYYQGLSEVGGSVVQEP